MASVSFYLRDVKSKSTTPILLIYRYEGQTIKYSTGEKILPKDWNSESQRVKKSVPGAFELNSLLDKLEEEFKKQHRSLVANDIEVSPDAIKILVDEKLHRQTFATQDFWDFFNSFISSVTSIKKKSTINTYHQTYAVLKDFEIFKRKKIRFNIISLDFYNDLVDYLTTQKKFSTNTIGKHVKILKTILSEASERGLNTKLDFKNKRFKVLSEETDSIYLSEEEILKMYHKNFSGNNKIERARDLFLIGCYTGLRFSDFSRITSENIENDFIKIRTLKTDELVAVPIHPILNEILKKYNYQLPKVISNQKLNTYLKEIGKEVGLTDTITNSRISFKSNSSRKKFELITTHTARRSFATNLYLEGFPSISIMKITGHKTEKAFMRYIKVSPEQHAKKLQDFWKANLKRKNKLDNTIIHSSKII
jgi:integrase